MTVGELKSLLEDYDEDLPVCIGMIQTHGSNFATELDGVFYGILDWKFEDGDESFDGGEAFAFACVDPRHWWEQK